MRINFVMPGYFDTPIGGFKVVYEYANHLAARGHQVTVLHPRTLHVTHGALEFVRKQRWAGKIRQAHTPLVPWFVFGPKVDLRLVTDLRPANLPDADATFATDVNTMAHVNALPPSKGTHWVFLQHYETWIVPEADVIAAWKLPIGKIAIARWLRDLSLQIDPTNPPTYIPNGLDFDRFHLTEPIADRAPHVGMLYHKSDWKGGPDGLAALAAAKREFPDLKATFFGATPRGEEIPDWIGYLQRPTPDVHLAYYNRCSIFLHPSWAEGWPLPPAEAMSCGCAIVAAANPGVMDYLTADETALTAPIKQPDALGEQLCRLLRDDALRQRIATAGHAAIQQYTWKRATDSLEALLTQT